MTQNTLIKDDNLTSIQTTRYIRCMDGNESNLKKSPITISGGSDITFIRPDNALVVTIDSSVDLLFGESSNDVNGIGNGYSLIRAEREYSKSIATQNTITLKNPSGSDALVYFEFLMI